MTKQTNLAKKCKFRIKVGNEYTYSCQNRDISFVDPVFEEWDNSYRFLKSSLNKAKRNRINIVTIDHLNRELKIAHENMLLLLNKHIKD